MDIIQAIDDPALFGGLFRDANTWRAWRVFLEAVFALAMTEPDIAVYRKHTGRTNPPKSPFSEVFAVVGRRGGKSFIAALIACYQALFKEWRPNLAPGERAWIMVIASDREQARVILGYIKGILSLPIFRRQVGKWLAWEVALLNQISIAVKTADFRAVRGYTIVCAILDELAFFRVEGANPAAEILHAIRPALATVPGSMLIGISTPYSRSGPLYEAFRDKFGRNDSEVLVWRATTREMNSTIPEKIVEKSLNEDRAAGRAEWLAEFRDDVAAFLAAEKIEAAIVPGRTMRIFLQGAEYFGFVDPSGGRLDSFTLAVAHREKAGRIVLDCLLETKPPFRPRDVVKRYAAALRSYGLSEVTGDKYAGEWVSSAFAEEKITFKPTEKDRSGIYLDFEVMMNQGTVDLLDLKDLAAQLRGLERRTRSGGRDSVDHYPGAHDDLANAAAGACVLAGREDGAGAYIGFTKHDVYPSGADDISLRDWIEISRRK